ncbi:MAG: 1-(5-phosphoribosyl)-5-[(5-phosphoribosylamino)methylideneamino] imidazole-4-carboxamide isomerase [Candidatus Altiarchaeum hamiconexum]|uniref:1-(5-phosphoribosyl)-5-[(5-phosphoribosylamino)methylideneamino] imidazole-4-carboxamide isomerase n=1 Tax=Candidatus Altarchaeum hamiconexum TaxID=1803513 RepID=A0A8J8CJ50_9ARCH|nr:1-(5-phosphoribosyl)-5-[(5-phosphoribosylamino)methylideneamino] imidazole-4-carboxamide isomerase [Candidatus Altarchaeum hamiconexum]PIN67125.1 MAG: 1-(5-phosphoribosyl)-5-((5-phosphoribosylamino)methylideneamino)imidazole-4-carboxamide isomerase [Candidatus Altarchaeum sp. CG12_big_fil_rev_8_21_14_0_65_33_22]PIV28107.1 MAG: 1-(5-phosphoribosyl)-5-((5-phosphoribosylamino)methylideneamino)imidazole-4-carboxamide isomerase [Candidatus Altarchaeum sp. CG03_land_8_20_14_0_80_32_618]PIZ30322.1 M
MYILPAIDLLSGKVARLTQGKLGSKKFYSDDPVEIAKKYDCFCLEILHIIDLDAALGTGKNNLEILKAIRKAVDAKIYFGGGIRSYKKAREILKILNPDDKIYIGTLALKGIDELKDVKENLIVAVDSKDGKVAVKGWKELTDYDTIKFMENFYGKCFGFLWTDISVEGMLKGINFKNIKKVVKASRQPVIVSGGISKFDDIEGISKISPYGIVLGKAIYEGKIDIKVISKFNKF